MHHDSEQSGEESQEPHTGSACEPDIKSGVHQIQQQRALLKQSERHQSAHSQQAEGQRQGSFPKEKAQSGGRPMLV